MKKLLWLLIPIIFLSGCATQQRCARKFPPQTITQIDSVVIIKDSIVYAQLPGDTVSIIDTVYIKDGIAFMSPKRLDTKYCYSIAEIRNSVFYMDVFQKEDSIPVQIVYKEIYVTKYEQVPYPVPAEFSWWEKLYLQIGKTTFIILAVFTGISIAFFILKLKFPLLKLWK